jgi:hypothetical protein
MVTWEMETADGAGASPPNHLTTHPVTRIDRAPGTSKSRGLVISRKLELLLEIRLFRKTKKKRGEPRRNVGACAREPLAEADEGVGTTF